MKYTSEIIQKVVTSDGCLKALERISPIYANAENFLHVMNAIFQEVDALAGFSDLLKNEVMPQTAQELLRYWEMEYGINQEVGVGVDEQRTRVLAKIRANASMNPYKLQELIRLETGVSALVVENTGKNKFTVRLTSNSPNESRHIPRIRDVINRYKPAHTINDLVFGMAAEDALYNGGIVRAAARLSMQNVDGDGDPINPDTIRTSLLGTAIIGEMVLGE